MYFGLAQLPLYPFVGWTAVILFAGSILAMFVFGLGRRGKRAAARYFYGVLGVSGALIAVIWVQAIVSGQFSAFLQAMGWSPLFEILVLTLITLYPFVFMAKRFVDGLPEAPSAPEVTEEGSTDA